MKINEAILATYGAILKNDARVVSCEAMGTSVMIRAEAAGASISLDGYVSHFLDTPRNMTVSLGPGKNGYILDDEINPGWTVRQLQKHVMLQVQATVRNNVFYDAYGTNISALLGSKSWIP